MIGPVSLQDVHLTIGALMMVVYLFMMGYGVMAVYHLLAPGPDHDAGTAAADAVVVVACGVFMALAVAVDALLAVMSGTCLSCWPWFLEWGQ